MKRTIAAAVRRAITTVPGLTAGDVQRHLGIDRGGYGPWRDLDLLRRRWRVHAALAYAVRVGDAVRADGRYYPKERAA